MQNKNYIKLINITWDTCSAYGLTCWDIKQKNAFASKSQA
jgi:hypothetical protein